jgi:hypothetical protein
MSCFSVALRRALGPPGSRHIVEWTLSLGLKRPERGADHSHSSSAKVKVDGAITPLSRMASWHSVKLIYLMHSFMCVFYDSGSKCAFVFPITRVDFHRMCISLIPASVILVWYYEYVG